MHVLVLKQLPQRHLLLWFVLLLALIGLGYPQTAQAATAVDVGYQNFQFGANCNTTPTGEKPESKLWFNDGFWWGSLCNSAGSEYHIYRFNVATHDWSDTGVVLDDREASKADVLWDSAAQKLYVASHLFTTTGAASAVQADWGRLYRYIYSTSTKSYTLDAGFPVTVTRGKSETLTLAKDSTGKLWVTYVESGKVMVNHSTSADNSWGTPYALPVTGATGTSSDDISSIISYSGRVGIMWSNQSTKVMYFASHLDSDVNDQSWQSISTYNPGGSGADDHINLKELQSAGGKLFAVTKTSFTTASQPLILLMACSTMPCTAPGNWNAYPIYTVAENDTRPILLIDTTNQKLHVFTTDNGSGGIIRHKTTNISNIQFAAGEGEVFIKNAADSKVNNSTSTKQNLDSSTGLLVLVSSQTSRFYYHNYLSLGASTPTNQPPTVNAGSDQAITLPATATLGGNASDDNQPTPPGALTTTWSKVSGPGTVTFGNANALNTTATFSLAGSYTLRLTANDGALSASDDLVVTVNAPASNQAPVVNAGPDQILTLPTTSTTLNASVSDDGLPVGAAVTTAWTQVDGPTGVTFGNGSAINTTATFPGAGRYTLRLTAGDTALTAFDEVLITVVAPASALTFTPVDDAQVKATSPTTNYGTLDALRLRGGDAILYRSYLKFNVTGVANTVQSAKVRLFVTDASKVGGDLYLVTNSYAGTATPWSEVGLIWNNAPTIAGSPLTSVGPVALGAWVEFDVTTAVRGNGVYSFGLVSGNTDSAIYSSKEGANPPQLVLTLAGGIASAQSDLPSQTVSEGLAARDNPGVDISTIIYATEDSTPDSTPETPANQGFRLYLAGVKN
jgi:hypothetical protein